MSSVAAARTPCSCQLTADRTGRTVLAGPVEATALGNVLVQARAAGLVDPAIWRSSASLVADDDPSAATNHTGGRAMRIALFITCLADGMFPQVGRATVAVLERLGHTVEFPAAQTCCGQMHVNTGYQKQALPLVRAASPTCSPATTPWSPRPGPVSARFAISTR